MYHDFDAIYRHTLLQPTTMVRTVNLRFLSLIFSATDNTLFYSRHPIYAISINFIDIRGRSDNKVTSLESPGTTDEEDAAAVNAAVHPLKRTRARRAGSEDGGQEGGKGGGQRGWIRGKRMTGRENRTVTLLYWPVASWRACSRLRCRCRCEGPPLVPVAPCTSPLSSSPLAAFLPYTIV